MRYLLTIFLVSFSSFLFSQEKNGAQLFWEQLQGLCGQAFEGTLVLPEDDEQFGGKKLVMHVRSCSDKVIKIPFFVGDDKSRTWILTYKNDRIELKHNHRHADGSDDEITMYGGITTNSGQATVQVFSADQHTTDIIPLASSNVWWITLDETVFSYNLRRVVTPRVFKATFDLKNPVIVTDAPWGWKED